MDLRLLAPLLALPLLLQNNAVRLLANPLYRVVQDGILLSHELVAGGNGKQGGESRIVTTTAHSSKGVRIAWQAHNLANTTGAAELDVLDELRDLLQRELRMAASFIFMNFRMP